MPYKGEAAAHLDMFGGVLDTAWANPATARTHLQAGKIKVLGIIGSPASAPSRACPPSPSRASRLRLDSWMGFFAPARTPGPVLDKLVAALREITQSPELRSKLLDMGFEPLGGTPEAFAASIKSESRVWAESGEGRRRETGVTHRA